MRSNTNQSNVGMDSSPGLNLTSGNKEDKSELPNLLKRTGGANKVSEKELELENYDEELELL